MRMLTDRHDGVASVVVGGVPVQQRGTWTLTLSGVYRDDPRSVTFAG